MKNLLRYSPNLVLAIGLTIAGFKALTYYNEIKSSKKQLRQISGLLSEKEQELQKQHLEFQVLESKLKANIKDLEEGSEKLRAKYLETDSAFQKFVREHDLQIKSYQRANYRLRQRIESNRGAEPNVTIVTNEGSCEENTEVQYRYEEKHGRVILETPNCLKEGGEVLTLNQSFVVYGEVYQQKDGALEISNLTLTEIDPNGKGIVISKAKLEGGDFKYHPHKPSPKPEKPFNIIAGIGFDKEGYGLVSLGVSPLKYKEAYLSLNYLLYEQRKTDRHQMSIRLGWRPNLMAGDLNLGLSVGVSTPVNQLAPQYTLTFDFFVW